MLFLLTVAFILDETCANRTVGNLLKINNASAIGVLYCVIYNSSRIDPTLLFIADMTHHDVYYLDSVSVVNITDSSVQLLHNSGFDNLSGNLDGWTEGCATEIGSLVNGTCQSNTCVKMYTDTNANGRTIYGLYQTFTAAIGQLYNISFWLSYSLTNKNQLSNLYVNIV